MSSSTRSLSREKSGIRYQSDAGGHQVNLNSLVARFESVPESDAGDELPALPLPGHGERYDGSEGEKRVPCGDPIPRFCADCGGTHEAGACCTRAECPRCWKGWDRRRATTITSKMEALRRYKEASGPDGWNGWKFHHITLSPPEGYRLNSDRPLHRTFQLVYQVLEELGAATGYVFYHPFRGAEGDDRGFWKDILPDGEEKDMTDTRAALSHEPHFHAVVLSQHVAGGFATKHVEEATGWVVERITKGDDGDVSIYDEFDLTRVVTYCLSHTGQGENRAAYRPFGEVANFTAAEEITNHMDAAVRSVAPNTLGLPYDSLACTSQSMVEGAKVNPAGIYGGDGDGAPPDEPDEEADEEAGECQGRLLPITKAPAFLDDDDWLGTAPRADELQEAWETWRWKVDTD